MSTIRLQRKWTYPEAVGPVTSEYEIRRGRTKLRTQTTASHILFPDWMFVVGLKFASEAMNTGNVLCANCDIFPSVMNTVMVNRLQIFEQVV
jgi:hypothetical protein